LGSGTAHPAILGPSSGQRIALYCTSRVDSNSTRTESCVAIRPDPKARLQVGALKAANHSGYQQTIRPSREMGAGLKILVSFVCRRRPFWDL